MLVTSRAPLHLSGEYTYVVAPLATPVLTAQQITADTSIGPMPASLWDVATAATYPAVALFAQRARAARVGLCTDAGQHHGCDPGLPQP